jgi:predicted esterase YcpF (UPF0227 family)
VKTTNTRDSEQLALLKQGPAIQAVQDLFGAEAEEDNDYAMDITKIIKSCLKDINKIKSKRALKMLSQIISVLEYIKLCAQYRQHNSCISSILKHILLARSIYYLSLQSFHSEPKGLT